MGGEFGYMGVSGVDHASGFYDSPTKYASQKIGEAGTYFFTTTFISFETVGAWAVRKQTVPEPSANISSVYLILF